ncbi:MAG: cryptochrome/photolyase family protein, partial [Pseudomonadota bacterium]
MTAAALILPHQLFEEHPVLADGPSRVVLFEDPLFFGDPRYPVRMHRQKLWLHRATMTRYAQRLRDAGHTVIYAEYEKNSDATANVIAGLAADGVTKLLVADPVDYTVLKRLRRATQQAGVSLSVYDSPGFLNTAGDNAEWAQGRKRWFMAEFYKSQRRRLDILMDGDEPAGGQWSFDEDNRKKIPKKLLEHIPDVPPLNRDEFDTNARAWAEATFPDTYGQIDTLIYPTSHEDAAQWLERFLSDRFHLFGDYEDAIVRGENWLWHSVLTPMLNTGLLTPGQVIEAALAHAARHDVPLNSVEGFVRQIIGWREFMRATYEDLGVTMRTGNNWNHTRPMPSSFYDATTGIDPIDDVIARVLRTGYCHHIERLMVLGG